MQVDVLLENGGGLASPEPTGNGIYVGYLPSNFFSQWTSLRGLPKRIALKLLRPRRYSDYSLGIDPVVFGLLKARRYSAVVGVDPQGISSADALNRWAKKPLVYISFEVLFAEEVTSSDERALKHTERAACERTSLVLIQDEERAEVFCREMSFPRDKLVLVPVAPRPQEVVKSDYLRKTLGIPPDKRIVLYCGNLRAWASRDELAEMVSYWPENYCLVIHSMSKIDNRRMAQYLKRLTETGKIYIYSQPVPSRDMASLVASADFGLAPYKPVPDHWMTSDNLYHLGFTSGKVSFYAMCGLPILARSLPVFEREFAHYKCGKVYRRVAETGEMLQEMDRDYAHYSAEARRFYQKRLNPTEGMDRFCNNLMDLIGVGERVTSAVLKAESRKQGAGSNVMSSFRRSLK